MSVLVHRLVLLLLAVYWLAMFAGTHVPLQGIGGGGNDKLYHFSAYAGLTVLLGWTFGGLRPTRWRLLALLAIVAANGVLDELTQQLIPGRSCDVADWIADVSGAVAGLGAYTLTAALLRTLFPRFAGKNGR